jgi:hypothetical protein
MRFGFQLAGRIAVEVLIARSRDRESLKEDDSDPVLGALLVGSMALLPIVGAVIVGCSTTTRAPTRVAARGSRLSATLRC